METRRKKHQIVDYCHQAHMTVLTPAPFRISLLHREGLGGMKGYIRNLSFFSSAPYHLHLLTQPYIKQAHEHVFISNKKKIYCAINLRPEAGAPISVTWLTLQSSPWYLGWYFAPVNGSCTNGWPLYIGVKEAAHMSNSAN